MPVAGTKFQKTVQQVVRGAHNLNGDTLKLALIIAADPPLVTDNGYSDFSSGEVAAGGGYTTGGNAITSIEANVGGLSTVRATAPVPLWTASGAGFSFRYLALFNDTDPAEGGLGFWDYGSTLVLDGVAGDTLQPQGFDVSIHTWQ